MLLNTLKYDLIYETVTLRVHKKCGDWLDIMSPYVMVTFQLVAKDCEKATKV